jgi:peptidoglycan hydrolase-like protein with peptidoglycan-binding domain
MSKDDAATIPFPGPALAGQSDSADPAPSYPGAALRQGSKGANVRTVQQQLSDLGYSLSVDGNFGPGTAQAVRAFQQKNNLGTDGVVGPNTWKTLWA